MSKSATILCLYLDNNGFLTLDWLGAGFLGKLSPIVYIVPPFEHSYNLFLIIMKN